MSILTPTPEWLEPTTEDQISSLLRRLRISGKLLGCRYLISGIAQTVSDPNKLLYITKELYPDLAKLYGAKPSQVERSMRHAIKKCWDCGGREALDQVAGTHLTQRPTNSEFIDLLANYIRTNN